MRQHFFLTVVCSSYFAYLEGFSKMWFDCKPTKGTFSRYQSVWKILELIEGFSIFLEENCEPIVFFGLESVKEVGKILLK